MYAFEKYHVDIHELYMSVICCFMFGVACCSNCAFIFLAPVAFSFLRLVILALTSSVITGNIRALSQCSLFNSIVSSFWNSSRCCLICWFTICSFPSSNSMLSSGWILNIFCQCFLSAPFFPLGSSLILLSSYFIPLSSSYSFPLSLLTCCQKKLGIFLSASQLSTSSVHLASVSSWAICFSSWRSLCSSWNCYLLQPITSICWFSWCISSLMFTISTVSAGFILPCL